MTRLYREHRIFSPKSERVELYVCVERLIDGFFAVSHAEFLYEGDQTRERMSEVSARTIELLLDDGESDERLGFYPTIQEAIISHQHEFADFEVSP